eukprot:s524_g9.t1
MIFAFQETRLRKLYSATDTCYLIYKSAAQASGQGGLMVGFNKQIAYATQQGRRERKHYFKDSHISYIKGDSRSLLLRIDAPFLRCVLIAGHAPHSGQSYEEIDDWWRQLSLAIPSGLRTWPVLLLTDANTVVGEHFDEHIGDWQSGKFEAKSEPFVEFVHHHDLLLPATHASFQRGPGETWQHSGGKKRRIDYIGIPMAWALSSCASWVEEAFDPAILSTDHSAICVEVRYKSIAAPHPRARLQTKLEVPQDIDMTHLCGHALMQPSFHVDVHTHAGAVQTQLEAALARHPRSSVKQPLKKTMSASTWEVVQAKRECRQHLSEADRVQKATLLEQCFLAWKGKQAHHVELADRLLCQQDQLIAQLLWQFRVLGRQVSRLLQRDDRAFFQDLTSEGSHLLHPRDVKKLWGVIRRSLPKFKNRRLGVAPHKWVHLEGQWIPYLADLEMGEVTSPDGILKACTTVQDQASHTLPSAVDLNELPTLQSFEASLRQTQLHALVRAKLIQNFVKYKDESQIGGFPGQQVLFGAQAVRAAAGIFAARGWSTAVLFVDLANAFHRLVREFIVGVITPEDLAHVQSSVNAAGCPLDPELLESRLLPILQRLGCSELLQRLVKDLHHGTWLTLDGEVYVRTRRGTRPGSPLADAVFHLLMGDVVKSIRAWITENADYMHLLQQVDLEPPIVVWSDDLAIVWATNQPAALPHAVACLMAEVDRQFGRRGFTINYDQGKSAAVVTFVGPQAPECRRQYSLVPKPGIEVEVSAQRTEWLHFVASYKHLGSYFSSSRSMEQEIRHRIGQAHGAFTQLARPLVCNSHYPRHIRLRLFHTLVCTRLFFGIGAWATPSLTQLKKLRVAYMGMLRKVLKIRSTTEDWVSTQQVLACARVGDVRARLALDRLAYAQKLYQHSPPFLQHLLAIEHRWRTDSWLHGLFSDLAWLRALCPEEVPPECVHDLTKLIDLWQCPTFNWKRCLRKAWKLYLAQEEMMWHIEQGHTRVYDVLLAHGAEFSVDPRSISAQPQRHCETAFPCHCGRVFSSPQGLALHKWKVHDQHAPEFHMVDGAVCPACLTFLWSSNRLRMHLTYMPRDGSINPCYEFLRSTGFFTTPTPAAIPAHLRGTMRLDALPGYGPLAARPHFVADALRQAHAATNQLEAALHISSWPEDHVREGERPGDALTRCTRMWTMAFCRRRDLDSMPVLADWWVELLTSYGQEFDDWAEMVFLLWGEHELPSLIEELFDGEAEAVLDSAYGDFAALLTRYEVLSKLSFMRQKRDRLLAEQQEPPRPHRPVKKGTANAVERQSSAQNVPHAYEEQVQWQASLRQLRWTILPPERSTPYVLDPDGTKRFFIVHLFSGRRRQGDLHHFLHLWSQQSQFRVTVLSFDTAVSVHYGDLDHRAEAWSQLRRCYSLGLIAATVLGTPCETFSEARYQQPPNGENWPRPLRSHDRPYGLQGLLLREVRQAGTGSLFFLQGLEVLAHHLTQGGLLISEHPAPPQAEERPTIWRIPLTQLLRQHPEVRLSVIGQWEWHAPAVKPTGLLSVRIPFLVPSMRSVGGLNTVKPKVVIVGKGPDGCFKTAGLKEYPTKLSEGLSKALSDQLQRDARTGYLRECTALQDHLDLADWLQQAAQACAAFSAATKWMPDYQG